MKNERLLIVVKTYPHPSKSYQELVCTAGMREDGSFVRLYPVDFRYRPLYQWYKKYQWIEVEVEKQASDPRPESYRPTLTSIKVVSEPLSSKNYWAERKQVVLARPLPTMCELRTAYQNDRTSLGIIKPKSIVELITRKDKPDWKESQKASLAQLDLFDQNKKPLRKIPYKFSYRFFCSSKNCKGHNMRITDWELGELFLKEFDRLGSEQKAIEIVQNKFWNELCSDNVDTHFFVGTTLPYNSWIVLGVFWPKKTIVTPVPQQNLELF